MTKKLKKLLSMVLVCTMLASLGAVATAFAATDFALASVAEGANVPIGMKVVLEATSLPSDAVGIEVFNASGSKIADATAADGIAKAECVVADDDNIYTAKAIDASGVVVAESNSVTVNGYREKLTHTRWDIDFSSHSIGAHRWGGAYVELKDSNGNTAASHGDGFTAHTGNSANTIATEDTGDASHGVALKLAAADDAEVQLNEFFTRLSGDVIKYEYDYKIDTLPTATDGSSGTVVMWPVMSDGSWLTHLGLSVEGDETVFWAGNYKMPAEAGKWYNIKCYVDTVNAVMAYYIDNVCLGAISIPEGITGGTKLVSKLNKCAGASVWIDNIKVQSVLLAYGVPAFSIGAGIGGKLIPAGMAVNTDATLLPEEATTVKYYTLDTNGETIKTLGTADVADSSAQYACKLSKGENRIYAEAFDASGNLVGKSNVITATGCYENTKEVRWDIDFSSHSVAAHRWGAPYWQINDNATGAAATSSGDSLTAHAGSAANAIASVDTGDADYGVAMTLAAADANQVQLNEFGATPTGNVIKYEIDYQLITLPTANDGTATINVLQAVLNNGAWVSALDLNANGSVLEFAGGGKTLAAELGKWYNIKAYADVVNGVMLYYIDDVYFASTSFASGATGGTKVVSKLQNAAGASCYIDNFKVSAVDVTVNPPAVGFKALGGCDMTLGGSTIPLTVSALPKTAEYTVIYKSDASENLGSEVARIEGDSADVKLGYGDNYFTAVAYSADGEVEGKETINVIGYVENVVSSRWDIDFSSHSVAAHRWGAPYWQINDNATGSAATSSGDSLTAHAGSADNTIATVDTGDASYGVAMKLYAYDNGQVQLNEFGATPTGDVIKYEYDYKLDSLPTNKDGSATINVMQPVMSGGKWLTSLDIGTDKPNAYFKLGNASLDVELGKWYNIKCYVDTVNDLQIYFIDNNCFAQTSISSDITTGQKIVSKLQNAAGAAIWIDNFKVQTVTTSVAKLELADVKYVVDGTEALVPTAGNLKVSSTVNNDGNARDIILFAAVYNGKELSGVQLAKHSFKVGEFTFTPDALDLGAVSADENVKVMLWSDDLAPLDADELINE